MTKTIFVNAILIPNQDKHPTIIYKDNKKTNAWYFIQITSFHT